MAHIITDLPAAYKEVESCHPLVSAKPGFPSEVVQVSHQSRHEIPETRVLALRVDANGVWCNIVNR